MGHVQDLHKYSWKHYWHIELHLTHSCHNSDLLHICIPGHHPLQNGYSYSSHLIYGSSEEKIFIIDNFSFINSKKTTHNCCCWWCRSCGGCSCSGFRMTGTIFLCCCWWRSCSSCSCRGFLLIITGLTVTRGSSWSWSWRGFQLRLRRTTPTPTAPTTQRHPKPLTKVFSAEACSWRLLLPWAEPLLFPALELAVALAFCKSRTLSGPVWSAQYWSSYLTSPYSSMRPSFRPQLGAAKAACRQKSAKRASLIIVYSFVLGRIWEGRIHFWSTFI